MAARPSPDPWQEDHELHRRRAREPRHAQHPPRLPPTRRSRRWSLMLVLSLVLVLVLAALMQLGPVLTS